MSKPRFSVLIPAYDASTTIAETIQSVRVQSCESWELVIVDDGSTDDTFAVALACASDDSRIRVVRQDNAGEGPARNTAAAHARGEFLCRLDADDLYLPEYLATQSAFIDENPGFDIYSCGGTLLFDDGHQEPLWNPAQRAKHAAEPSLDLKRLFHEGIFGMAIVRASSFHEIGGYRAVRVEDLDLWTRMLAYGFRHICNPVDLGVYRRHSSAMSSDVLPGWLDRVKVMDELASSPLLKSEADRKIILDDAARTRARIQRELWIRGRDDPRWVNRKRLAFLGLGPAFDSKLVLVAESAMVLISPRLYSRTMLERRDRIADRRRRGLF